MPYTPLISDLRATLGCENVLSAPSELAVYDCDAFTIERRRPEAVVFPRSAQDVAEIVKLCGRHGASVVARGAGTSLAGGCLPLSAASGTDIPVCQAKGMTADKNVCPTDKLSRQNGGAVVVMLTRMNKVLEIDLRNRMAVVEAGVANLRLTQALAGTGFHFAPDPSSQGASSIGGNVATNAGGPHTLKYGVTVNHVLGLEVVLSDGSILQLGPADDTSKIDLIGLLVGSEGTLGIVTKIWVRLTPNAMDYRAMRAIFPSIDEASNAVSQIIAAGIVPAAMELMDQGILAAVEEAYHFGFPPEAQAVLVIEVDGHPIGLDRQQERIVDLCKKFGASDVLQASTAGERELLWKCRKMAVGATGRLSPSYTIQDGVVPRTKLPQIIRRTAEIGRKYQIRIVNVAHAGDGNIHPILLFDERDREQVGRAVAAGHEILEECIAAGGSITAEHGIGVEKIGLMDRLFAPADLEAMRRVRGAFDPIGLLNPGKLIPREKGVRNLISSQKIPDTLSLSKLNRVIDYPSDDMTVTVEAGMTIGELNKLLAEKRQWLPVDVAFPDRTTVGEAVAVNASGPRRYAYGTMRDYVLGFTAVDGTGMTFSGGGRVVKNAAGYNMCRLMAGSRGTLGILTQVTLMVRPLPEAAALLACEVSDFDLAEKLLASLVRSQVRPVAVELSAGRSREGNPLFGPMLEGNVARLYVGFEGMAVEVEWMLNRLREEWTAAGMTSPMLMPNLATDKLWTWMAEFPTEMRLNFLPSKTVETIAQFQKISPECLIQSHAGDGEILLGGAGFELGEPEYVMWDGENEVRVEENEIEDDGLLGGIRILRALKERFDPKNILSPEQINHCNELAES